jgi:hypothetical protein
MVATDFLPRQKIRMLRAFASLTSSHRAHFFEFFNTPLYFGFGLGFVGNARVAIIVVRYDIPLFAVFVRYHAPFAVLKGVVKFYYFRSFRQLFQYHFTL